MPRDYKERPARKKNNARKGRKGGRGPARWPAFVAGACLGALLTAAGFLYEPDRPRPEQASAGDAAGPDSARGERKPRFEFYTVLPEKEILIPEPSLDLPPASATDESPHASASQASRADDDTRYVLQVASLRSMDDADSLKARLALLGLQSSIQTVSVDGEESWHRVRVGPFTGRTALDEARAQLRRNDFDVLVLKLR